MSEIAARAQKAGLTGVAFTDHVEWVPEDEAYEYLDPSTYFVELERLRARYKGVLTLLAGIEAGSPHRFPAETNALLRAWPWDIVIGSAHWVDGLAGWEPVAFKAGLEAAYERYFQELVVLTREGNYDILGHLDIVRRDSWALFQQVLPLEPYADLIRQALRYSVQRGKGLEINTSGWRYRLPDPLPGLLVLRWYRELGGEILVFGSDAHSPEAIAWEFERARALALEAGFTRLARFEQRRVVDWLRL